MLKLRQLCLAVVIAVGGLVATAGVTGQVAFGAQLPPPDCRYDDVLTQHDDKDQWQISLLDSIYMLPRSYVPPSLVSVSHAGIDGVGKIRSLVIEDLAAMAKAARKAGTPLRVVSSYRSWSEQQYLYQREVDKYGLTVGRQSVARPGHSEHQLGTTIDFGTGGSSKKAWAYSDWAKTPSGSWIKAHGWKYGFLLSYPDGTKSRTCYRYEPWHYRYVGRDIAAQVHGSGLTLREFIWKNYE